MYTDRIDTKIILPSGNWFDGFNCDVKAKAVSFSYRDRRRDGQVARRYMVFFDTDLKIIDIVAVSVKGSRVEHFGSCRAEKYCRELLLEALEGTDTIVDEKPASKKGMMSLVLFMLFCNYTGILLALPFLTPAIFDRL